MTQEETILEFCKLLSRVNTEVFNSQHAANCFCGDNPSFSYENDGVALDFIKQAVQEKIDREHAKSHGRAGLICYARTGRFDFNKER